MHETPSGQHLRYLVVASVTSGLKGALFTQETVSHCQGIEALLQEITA